MSAITAEKAHVQQAYKLTSKGSSDGPVHPEHRESLAPSPGAMFRVIQRQCRVIGGREEDSEERGEEEERKRGERGKGEKRKFCVA